MGLVSGACLTTRYFSISFTQAKTSLPKGGCAKRLGLAARARARLLRPRAVVDVCRVHAYGACVSRLFRRARKLREGDVLVDHVVHGQVALGDGVRAAGALVDQLGELLMPSVMEWGALGDFEDDNFDPVGAGAGDEPLDFYEVTTLAARMIQDAMGGGGGGGSGGGGGGKVRNLASPRAFI